MPSLAHRLSKLKLTTFKPSYSPSYANLSTNHIASNTAHPLCIAQRRRQQERPRHGLWWCATTGLDVSKSSCVRTWARRRMRHALLEVGGFSFWEQLPPEHSGEDVAAQWRVMEKYGGAGLLPSGAVHLEAPTTIPERPVDAFDVVMG